LADCALIHVHSIAAEAHRRFRIALCCAIQPNPSRADQFSGLRPRAIAKLRQRASQSNTPDLLSSIHHSAESIVTELGVGNRAARDVLESTTRTCACSIDTFAAKLLPTPHWA
jgi:hypothetical protein